MLRIGIDVGGTFTDLIAVDTVTAERAIVKISSTPHAPETGALAALDALLERYATLPSIDSIAHSTTIGTNALLGQIGLELPKVVFVTTHGFRDVIEIGRQNRSEVYNLFVTRRAPLSARDDRITVRERIDYTGSVLLPLEQAEVERVVEEVAARSPGAVAIGLLHSYANDAHERRLAGALRERLGEVTIACSSQTNPEYREYERFSTTLVDAALTPVVRRYIERLTQGLRERGIAAPLHIMQSSGGLTAAQDAPHPAAMIESGPASGAVAASSFARDAELSHVLSFDMGGTTAKAATVLDGIVQVTNEFEAAGTTHSGRATKGSGYPVRFPFVDLAEVSAGGGTIAWVDEAGSLRVGPLSAGADPGPACYGKSERATVTDANVVLGKLNQRALLGGAFPIDARRSRRAVQTRAAEIGLTVEQTAAGIVRIVDAQMAKVLRIVTVERGLDTRDFTMVAFGGNGPLHACALAEELGIRRVLVPREPGVFSALGLLVAQRQATFVRSVLRDVHALNGGELDALFDGLSDLGLQMLTRQGASATQLHVVRECDLRYRGQSFELTLPYAPDCTQLAQNFHDAHQRRYGYCVPNETVEIVNARLTASAPPPSLPKRRAGAAPLVAAAADHRDVWVDESFVRAPVYARDDLGPDACVAGAALIEQYDTCTYVAPRWAARNAPHALVLDFDGTA